MAASAGFVQYLGVFLCVAIVIALLPGLYGGELFPWHPFFMTIGFLGFMSEGLIAAYKFRPAEGAVRVGAIQNHAWVQAAAAASVALGFWCIYKNKVLHGKPHFTSLHGKVGLITLGLAAAAPLLGLLSFKRLGLLGFFPDRLQPRVKWLHRLVGVLVWVLALVTMQLDLPHPAVLEGLWCRLWQLGVVVMGAGMLSLLRQQMPSKSALPLAFQIDDVKMH